MTTPATSQLTDEDIRALLDYETQEANANAEGKRVRALVRAAAPAPSYSVTWLTHNGDRVTI